MRGDSKKPIDKRRALSLAYRRIDDLGRVVIPKVWRIALGVREGDELRMELRDGGVWLSKQMKGDV